jgi:hypothetical protein
VKTSVGVAWLVLGLGAAPFSFAQTSDAAQKPAPRPVAYEVPDVTASRSYPANAIAAILQETSHGGKLAPPITVQVSRGKALDADTQELLLTVACTIPTTNVTLAAEAIQGFTLLEPTTKWQFPLSPGSTKTVAVPVRLDRQAPRRLLVAATITLTSGESQSVADTFLLQQAGDTPADTQRGLLPGARLVKGPSSRLVQEVPARIH